MTHFFRGLALALLTVPTFAQYLSNLRADARFPLYTTYAAAPERSNFVLDEGYHFRYYVPTAGADFTTDTGGDWCLGFRVGNRWLYRVRDFHRPPVITASYPDLVRYVLEPVAGLRVVVRFAVYSSTGSLMDVRLTNESPRPLAFDVVPFLRSAASGFHSVEKGGNQVVFRHEEHPDAWTLGHGVPYADRLRDVWLSSDARARPRTFNAEAGQSPLPPVASTREKPARQQVQGRLYGPTGDRLVVQAPAARLQLYVDDDPSVLLTENSPVWGTNQPPLDPEGFFRLEAAHLRADARRFHLAAWHEGLGRSARDTGLFSGKPTQRVNLRLNQPGPPTVTGLAYRRGRLTWSAVAGAFTYAVYRRDYPAAVYRRVARGLRQPAFREAAAPVGTVGYVVAAEDARGNLGVQSREVTNLPVADFDRFLAGTPEPDAPTPFVRVVALPSALTLQPGASETLRLVRTVQRADEPPNDEARQLLTVDPDDLLRANERRFARVPPPRGLTPEQEALYWSSFAMMRQVFYPPEGKCERNYYVFSREPTWGWGHGGQVFHESIAMLAYALFDPESAMNSQRVYADRQHPNGYVNYRTGPYLDEVIEQNGEQTSSAPWYAYLNWEVYQLTKDRAFLRDMYASSKRFYRFYVAQRDKDGDGLCEWGGEAVLESVRDALVAVWDEVGYPTNFESVDLNCLLVMEAKSLENMALALGLTDEAAAWRDDHRRRAKQIEETFWDEANGFYYNVERTNHTFSFRKPNDLKRDEIIGFLPLWAGVAAPERAARLVQKLKNGAEFGRPFGVPSLSAKDLYYNPKGYWNGPVWVEWNFLVVRGLLDYGYRAEARDLTTRVAAGMTQVLRETHTLWEFYGPDEPWGGYHHAYVWAGIINRMLLDTQP